MRIETDDGQPLLENVIPPQSMWTGRCSVCHVEIGDTSLDIRWQFKPTADVSTRIHPRKAWEHPQTRPNPPLPPPKIA